MRNRRRGLRLRPLVDQLDGRCLLSSLTPTLLTGAYGLTGLKFTTSTGAMVKGDGSGETIALIEAYHDPTLASDLKTFDQMYKLPDPSLSVVNQAGAQTNSGWAGEESLDVEWAHAVAPGASILVVEAKSQSIQDLLAAVNTARYTPGVVAVSMSWGFGEMPSEASYDSYFTTPPGHVGITFVASSGDGGSFAGASYPAASPNVLSVGGTTLTLSASGAYQSETAWISSGGGYSQYEPEPSYQASVQSTGARSTPDVAFDADPNTGVPVYQTQLYSSQPTLQYVGGTSLGAPSWAALIAIADQGRAVAGKGSLDGPTQTLPTLYSLPSTDFHSVSSVSTYPGIFGPFGGSWSFGGFPFNSPWSGFGASLASSTTSSSSSSSGANTVTGLGSPIGSSLVSGLVTSNMTVPLTTTSGSSQQGTSPGPPTSPVHPRGGKQHRPVRRGHNKSSKKTHAAASAGNKLVAQGLAAHGLTSPRHGLL
jgi:subtilase family serine protease